MSIAMDIPFNDLKAQYLSIRSDINEAISGILDRTEFIGGHEVKTFEQEFAKKIGSRFCIGVGNGTDAIFVALKSLGIGPGDEVVTAANTFIGSAEPIAVAGATPVFVDCDPETYTIDTKKLEQTLHERSKAAPGKIKAIIPVHLYGRMADMTRILALAEKYHCKVIEDCAQAHLAVQAGKAAGTSGHIGCFSFYPGKNLGAYGDAGAVVTDDEALAKRIRMTANHGRLAKYDHEFEGVNSRLDSIQAAILRVKLRHLDSWTSARVEVANLYEKHLHGVRGISTPGAPSDGQHVFHLYVIRVKNRTELQDKLKETGIATAVHYPTALPNLKAFSRLGYSPKDFPIASQYQNEILSLPIFPELTEEKIAYVAKQLKSFTQ